MSVLASIRSQLVPIHREGRPFIAAFAVATLVLFWLWSPLGWLGAAATLWCAYFFRDPDRVTPVRDGIVVAPADGRVSRVTNAVPAAELGLGERPLSRVSIFMSVFDCHVNRSPVTGKIERIDRGPELAREPGPSRHRLLPDSLLRGIRELLRLELAEIAEARAHQRVEGLLPAAEIEHGILALRAGAVFEERARPWIRAMRADLVRWLLERGERRARAVDDRRHRRESRLDVRADVDLVKQG